MTESDVGEKSKVETCTHIHSLQSLSHADSYQSVTVFHADIHLFESCVSLVILLFLVHFKVM